MQLRAQFEPKKPIKDWDYAIAAHTQHAQTAAAPKQHMRHSVWVTATLLYNAPWATVRTGGSGPCGNRVLRPGQINTLRPMESSTWCNIQNRVWRPELGTAHHTPAAFKETRCLYVLAWPHFRQKQPTQTVR